MKIPTINFKAEDIKLHKIFDQTEKMDYTIDTLPSEKIEYVYGSLKFGVLPKDRPLAYASYVMSVDGKIAFMDNEVGPLIAKNNYYDPNGGLADFWMLNLLRANCDGIIIGSGTMIKEPSYSGSTYDPDLIDARLKAGKHPAPWTVIVTRTGKNIPYGNDVFKTDDIKFVIATSSEGFENLKQEIDRAYYVLPSADSEFNKAEIKRLTEENQDKIAIVITGTASETNSEELMAVLKAMGMDIVLVESPSYCHLMMRERLLDEIFITNSCLFVGGQATSLGTFDEAFTSTEHPHCEIVTMHMHSPHFIYTRYKMRYEK